MPFDRQSPCLLTGKAYAVSQTDERNYIALLFRACQLFFVKLLNVTGRYRGNTVAAQVKNRKATSKEIFDKSSAIFSGSQAFILEAEMTAQFENDLRYRFTSLSVSLSSAIWYYEREKKMA
jgi:hypothetical protein